MKMFNAYLWKLKFLNFKFNVFVTNIKIRIFRLARLNCKSFFMGFHKIDN